ELFERGPERLVVRIVPVPSVDLVRSEEHRPEAELADAAPGFGHRIVDVERRDHAGPEQALRILLAEVVEPVVVGARHGRGERRGHVGDREGVEAAGPLGRRGGAALGCPRLRLNRAGPAPPGRRTLTPSRRVVKGAGGCYLIVMIPVIDLGPYLAGRPRAFAATAAELGRALETVGFFVVVGHRVPQSLIDATFAEARRFHA